MWSNIKKKILSSSSLRINSLWNLIGNGAPILLGSVTIPFLINRVGLEAFGILTLVWALIGYFSLFDFGLGRALTQQIAIKRASGLYGELAGIVKTGLLLTLLTGVVGGVLLAAFSGLLGHKWLNISAELQEITVYSLLIASLGIPLTTVTSGLRGILEAYENFKTVNLLRMYLGFANFGLPAVSVLLFGPRLDLMVASIVLARFVVTFAHLIYVLKITSNFPRGTEISKKIIATLLTFGVWMTASNIISPLMVVADRFIISNMLGAGEVAFYTVPFEVLIRVLIVPAALTAALFPRLATIFAVDPLKAKNLYKNSLKIVVGVMFLICLCLAAGSYWALKLWLGDVFARSSWHIASILAIGVFLNSAAQIPYAYLHAQGRVKETAIVHFLEFLIYIPILFIFLKYFGLQGAAAAWVIRAGLDLIILISLAKVDRV
jgi:O-antigen/teichoic acid export membrane protein